METVRTVAIIGLGLIGSSIARAVREAMPAVRLAGHDRDEAVRRRAVEVVTLFWEALGAKVEVMDPRHHDMVLAVTSHVPHLIAFTIVGTASDLEEVTSSEVIKYSAGGFRDFTRIAASNPVMWRDIF